MNKVSEYSERIVKKLKLDLENELILSIYDMLKGVNSMEVDLNIDSATKITYIDIVYVEDTDEIEEIEITENYLDDDGELYDYYKSPNELDLTTLYALWEYLKEKAE